MKKMQSEIKIIELIIRIITAIAVMKRKTTI